MNGGFLRLRLSVDQQLDEEKEGIVLFNFTSFAFYFFSLSLFFFFFFLL